MRPQVSILTLFFFVFLTNSGLAAETVRQSEQRLAVQKQLELRFGEINQKVGTLQYKSPYMSSDLSSSADMKDETRREIRRLREELHKKQETVNSKLSRMGSSTGPDFDRMRAEVNAAIEDLNNLYGRISSLSKSL